MENFAIPHFEASIINIIDKKEYEDEDIIEVMIDEEPLKAQQIDLSLSDMADSHEEYGGYYRY